MKMKKAKEGGLDGRSGGNESGGESSAQAREGDHFPMSSASSAGHQVQASLLSPQPPREGG